MFEDRYLFQTVLKHEKPIKTNERLMIANKNIVKHMYFDTFEVPNEVSKPQKPKKTNGFLMVMLKKHCKT